MEHELPEWRDLEGDNVSHDISSAFSKRILKYDTNIYTSI